MITFAFGLFHGFGFGGLLSAIDLPQEQVLAGLLGFNLGVEFGQIVILLAAVILGPFIVKILPRIKHGWKPFATAGLVCYGVFLFTTRALF